jgi:hypothetical protein
MSAPVRGTQTFVYTLSSCWTRPSLTGLEVAWRWVIGVPTIALVVWQLRAILERSTGGTLDVARLGLDRRLMADPVGALSADPMGAAGKLVGALGVVLPDLEHLAAWMVPLLLVVWVVASSLGRTAVLKRADARLHTRPVTLMLLQAVRMVALTACFGTWLWCLGMASRMAIQTPIASGQEPNLVLYCAIVIVATIGLFVLWAAVSWVFSVAPLLAMLRNLGPAASLAAAFRLGPLKAKLVEINLVMGIVKIALIVLAMVFSATPLPFESVTTPEFLAWWWCGVTVAYLVASDFFHVARLVGYLELWRAYEHEIPRFATEFQHKDASD